jgi:MFS family permease
VGGDLDVLRLPRVAAVIGSSLVGRLHESMLSFAAILLVSPVHGYSASGLVLAAAGAGQTVGAPFWGRHADRAHRTTVLVATASAQAAALVALATAGGRSPPRSRSARSSGWSRHP